MDESMDTLSQIMEELKELKTYLEENHTTLPGPWIHNAIRIMKEQNDTIQQLESERRRCADELRKVY